MTEEYKKKVVKKYIQVTLNEKVFQQLFELGIVDSDEKTELTSIEIPSTYTYKKKKLRKRNIR